MWVLHRAISSMIGLIRRSESMRTKSILTLTGTLIGLIAAVLGGYTFARFFLHPEPAVVFSTTYGAATPLPFPVFEPKTATKLPGRIHSFTVSPDMKSRHLRRGNPV
jgi:hypothetical protein